MFPSPSEKDAVHHSLVHHKPQGVRQSPQHTRGRALQWDLLLYQL
jgi:hypothetical protein